MRTVFVATLVACLAASTASTIAAADEPFFSGPQAGEKMAAFKMKGLLGGVEGKEVDPVTAAAGKPVVLVFVHQVTRPSIGTMRIVMDYATSRAKEGMHAAVVLLTSDVTSTTSFVKRARHAMPKNVALGVSPDGLEGPGAYGLNRKATITAIVGKDGKVTANFALIEPSVQADAPKIATAIAAALGDKKPVTLAALNASRPAMRKPAMRKPGDRKPGGRKPGGRLQDPQLETLVRAVIAKDASKKQVDEAAARLEAYCNKTPAAARRVGDISGRITASGKLGNYGTATAQNYLKKWAEKYGEKK